MSEKAFLLIPLTLWSRNSTFAILQSMLHNPIIKSIRKGELWRRHTSSEGWESYSGSCHSTQAGVRHLLWQQWTVQITEYLEPSDPSLYFCICFSKLNGAGWHSQTQDKNYRTVCACARFYCFNLQKESAIWKVPARN